MAERQESQGNGRIPAEIAATLRATSPYQDRCPGEVSAMIVDVASEGLKVTTRAPLERGWRVAVHVDIRLLRQRIEVTAEVAWSRRNAVDGSGQFTSGLTFDPPRQSGADSLLGLFFASFVDHSARFYVPPIARLEGVPPLL